MIKIKVYGPGCKRCKKAFESIEALVKEEYLDKVEVEKVEDFKQMLKAKVVSTPTIAIGETILSSGTVPKPNQVREWIENALHP